MKLLINLLMTTTLLTAGIAHAENSSDKGMSNWRSQDALEQLASDKNWQIRSVDIDGAFYVLRGWNADGAAIKAYINPLDLKVIDVDEDTDVSPDQQNQPSDSMQ